MCPIQHGTGPNSHSSIESLHQGAESDSEPNEVTHTGHSLIIKANNRTRLLTILKSYGIVPVRNSSFSNWSESLVCPFPAHKGGNERTPSFGYNFAEDRFNCFGCRRSGRTVEFLSFMNGVSKFLVAEQILRESEGYDFDDNVEEDINPKIEKLIFGFSSFLQKLIQKYKNNDLILSQINKIVWWFDQYLAAKAPKNKISVEELSARISKAKELLEEFEDE